MTLTAQHGWHFVGETLRYGRPVPPDGETLRHEGPLVLCESGLHLSRTPWDALQYAPGATLCLVLSGGETIESDDKAVCRERTILSRMDATDLLRYFARLQALSVLEYWHENPPEVVLDYLMTDDETLRDTAESAAFDAVLAAAAASTRAGGFGAWCAPGAAERAAAWAAAEATAWGAARAARAAARSARAAARSDAEDAAWDAARDEFDALVYECFGVQA